MHIFYGWEGKNYREATASDRGRVTLTGIDFTATHEGEPDVLIAEPSNNDSNWRVVVDNVSDIPVCIEKEIL